MDSGLEALAARGIFPGPIETQEDFLARAPRLLPSTTVPPEPLARISALFDASPDWIQIDPKARGLMPWEGAATWIEDHPQLGRTCTIQTHDTWASRLYPQEEVIAHEMVHAMRLMFDEDRFEEILAYRTSKNRFRRYFGPLFSNPSESKWFLILLLASWLVIGAEWLLERPLGGDFFLFAPFLVLCIAVFRLVRSQSLFSSALSRLDQVLPTQGKALAVALSLTDAEIIRFSRSTGKEISTYIEEQKEHSLRWEQIYQRFRL